MFVCKPTMLLFIYCIVLTFSHVCLSLLLFTYSVISDSFEILWTHARLLCPWNFPDQNTEVRGHFLLQGIFPNQRLNSGLPLCKRILYQLSHKGSPRILEWVAYPCSSGSSQPRNRTRVSCIAGRYLPTELSGRNRCCKT